jgi:hypothetical protein
MPDLRALLEAPEHRHADAERAYQARNALRDAAYTAERAHADAVTAHKDARRTRAAILRALYHLPDVEPYTPEPEPYAHRTNERRYQTHRATATAWTYRQGRDASHADAYGHADGSSTALYRSARGTNDPTKLAAELDCADAAARAWIETQTARAYLAAQGIDPDTAPAVTDLVTIDTVTMTRTDYWHGRTIDSVRTEYALRLTSTAETIATCPTFDALDRDAYTAAAAAAPTTDHERPAEPVTLLPAEYRALLEQDRADARTYWQTFAAGALPALLHAAAR